MFVRERPKWSSLSSRLWFISPPIAWSISSGDCRMVICDVESSLELNSNNFESLVKLLQYKFLLQSVSSKDYRMVTSDTEWSFGSNSSNFKLNYLLNLLKLIFYDVKCVLWKLSNSIISGFNSSSLPQVCLYINQVTYLVYLLITDLNSCHLTLGRLKWSILQRLKFVFEELIWASRNNISLLTNPRLFQVKK